MHILICLQFRKQQMKFEVLGPELLVPKHRSDLLGCTCRMHVHDSRLRGLLCHYFKVICFWVACKQTFVFSAWLEDLMRLPDQMFNSSPLNHMHIIRLWMYFTKLCKQVYHKHEPLKEISTVKRFQTVERAFSLAQYTMTFVLKV